MRVIKLLLVTIVVSVALVFAIAESQGTAASTAEPQPQWVDVVTFSGNSAKDTETFPIASRQWRVTYESAGEDGVLYIYAHADAKDGGRTLVSNKSGKGSETTYLRNGPGNFYLSINSANTEWTITVQEPR